MAIDLNADIGEIFKSLLKKKDGASGGKKDNGSGGKKPTDPFIKYIAIGVLFLVLIIMYLFFVYFPMQEERERKEEKIAKVEDMRLCISQLDNYLTSKQATLKFSKDRYDKLTKMFHSGQEIDDLYRHISMLALSNQLMVSKIDKVGEDPIAETSQPIVNSSDENGETVTVNTIDLTSCDSIGGANLYAGDTSIVEDANNNGENPRVKVAYYELKVQFEISGNYNSYTKFREGLAKLDKIININKEDIIVLESETAKGQVKVDTVLAIYRMPATDEERYMQQNN